MKPLWTLIPWNKSQSTVGTSVLWCRGDRRRQLQQTGEDGFWEIRQLKGKPLLSYAIHYHIKFKGRRCAQNTSIQRGRVRESSTYKIEKSRRSKRIRVNSTISVPSTYSADAFYLTSVNRDRETEERGPAGQRTGWAAKGSSRGSNTLFWPPHICDTH